MAAEDKARVDAVSDSDDEDDLIGQQLEVVQERWVLLGGRAGEERLGLGEPCGGHAVPDVVLCTAGVSPAGSSCRDH